MEISLKPLDWFIRQDDVGIARLDAARGRRLAKVQTIKESRAIHAHRVFDVRLA